MRITPGPLGTLNAGTVSLAGGKFVPIVGANLATGNTDLYTVPAGKFAYVERSQIIYNASGGSVTYYPELKVGATYYRLGTATTVATTVGATPSFGTGMVLNAGEVFAVNCATTAGLNVRGSAWEWDATDARLATARNLALASGNNTLFTVPAGKTVALVVANLTVAFAAPTVQIANSTGGSLNYYLNIVPSGGSVGATNQFQVATAVADVTSTAFNAASALAAGDFINVNSSGADASAHQIAWVTYYQIP